MSLSLYLPEQEENIFIRKQAETWRRSDLITEQQLGDINNSVRSDLHQTNLFFRILFFVFTLLCAGAMVGLFTWLIHDSSDKINAVVLICFGVFYYIVAEYIVVNKQLYRYGIEEALAMMAMLLFCTGCGLLLHLLGLNTRQSLRVVSVLFALAGFWIYLRFGYLYAALTGIIALCMIPFQFSLSPTAERLILLGILCITFLVGFVNGREVIEDFKKERNTLILTCLLAAIYLTVNLHVFGLIGLFFEDIRYWHFHPRSFPPWIYWSSYVLAFIIPVCGIYWGIQSRRRLILNLSLVMACVTLATNKSYLGMTRYAWDPAILGIVMIGLSLWLTRWLNSGPEQKRFGFTAIDILKPENSGISIADVAAALTPGTIDAQQPPQAPQDKFFEGGSSGGGGAERKF